MNRGLRRRSSHKSVRFELPDVEMKTDSPTDDAPPPPPPAPGTVPHKPWTQVPRRHYRLVDARLIDPKDGSVHSHVTIDLRDGLIRHLTKLTNRPSPEEVLSWTHNDETTIINLAGKFVLPGLIDCHVHLATPPGENGLKDTLNQDEPSLLLRQPYLALSILKRGFTSLRDCGGASPALRTALSENLFPGPRLFIAGHAISQTGGHGDLRGASEAESLCCGGPGHIRGLGRVADGVDACLRAGREELRRGADFLKIMVSGGVVSPTDRVTQLQYLEEELRAFVRVAEDAGTTVTAHAYTAAAIRRAVEAGVKGVEHGNLLDEGTARLMAEKGVFLTPTLCTYAAMAETGGFGGFLPPEIARKNLEVLEAGFRSVQIADRAGVTMCYGTDLLGPLQVMQTKEFVLRKQAGLSDLKILQSATVNAARMLRQENRLGRVKEGYAADLLILNANPLENIEVLDRPEKHLLAVIKDGRVLESRWSKLPRDGEFSNIIE